MHMFLCEKHSHNVLLLVRTYKQFEMYEQIAETMQHRALCKIRKLANIHPELETTWYMTVTPSEEEFQARIKVWKEKAELEGIAEQLRAEKEASTVKGRRKKKK